jgi:hypothetical protein
MVEVLCDSGDIGNAGCVSGRLLVIGFYTASVNAQVDVTQVVCFICRGNSGV